MLPSVVNLEAGMFLQGEMEGCSLAGFPLGLDLSTMAADDPRVRKVVREFPGSAEQSIRHDGQQSGIEYYRGPTNRPRANT